jgi:hypothetical protein
MTFAVLLFLSFIIIHEITIKEDSLLFTDHFLSEKGWYVEGFIPSVNKALLEIRNTYNNSKALRNTNYTHKIFDREQKGHKTILIPLNTVKTINRHAYLTD